MRTAVVLFSALLLIACSKPEYRFERVDYGASVPLPMKLDSMEGLRDADSVKARLHFTNGADHAQIDMAVHLGPPAEFTAGTFQSMIEGQSLEGVVESKSITYLGGQGSVPSLGGVFVLKDAHSRPIYRVTIPPTPIQRPAR
jgi:hypothetical protein